MLRVMPALLLLLALTAVALAADPAPTGRRFAMCGNINGIAYWANDWPFVDLMKSASDWRVGPDDSSWTVLFDAPAYADGTVVLDENGYPYMPGRDFRSGEANILCFRALLPGGNEGVASPDAPDYRPLPTGDYTLIAEGTGTIVVRGGGFEETTVPCRGSTTRETIRRGIGQAANVEQWTQIRITASRADDHVRNIRLIMPGHAETYESQPFHPTFLENIRPFAKYRLMDWCSVNGSPIRRWDQRTRPGWYSYASPSRRAELTAEELAAFGQSPETIKPGRLRIGQVPYEVMADLANTLDRDIWICVPAMADDDYVRQLATLFRDRLEPGRVLTVEYANELFNRAFLVNEYGRVQGERLFGGGGRQGQSRFFVKRMTEIYRIVNEVYGYRHDENGLENPARRVRFVMPIQQLATLAEPEFLDAVKVDHVIENFYFGIDWPREMVEQDLLNRSVDWLVNHFADRLDSDPRLARLPEQTAEVAAFSRQHYPVTYVTYEGSSHFHHIWWNKDLEAKTGHLTERMDIHPRIYEFYARLFRVLETGGAVHDNYIFVIVGGGFGHRRYPTQPLEDAHKYRACLDYIEGRLP